MKISILCYKDHIYQDGMRITYSLQRKNHSVQILSLLDDPSITISKIKNFKPQFCLVTIGRNYSPEALLEIKKHTFLVHWSYDEMTPDEDSLYKDTDHIYDLTFVKSKGLIPLVQPYVKKVIWTPMFYDIYFDGKPRENSNKVYNLIFTGNPHVTQSTSRQQYLKQLSEDNLPVIVVGHYWKGYEIGNHLYPGGALGTDLITLIAQSRIGLNFQNDLMANIELGFSDRVIKTMGAGTFCLTHEIKGIEQLFIPGIHLQTYKNYVDLKEKILYYITHEDEREKIAKAGHDLVWEKYSIDQVVEIYLEEIQKTMHM
jgi:hypothetical protein